MEYPKINSLWKREDWYFEEGKKRDKESQKGRQSFIIGNYAREEFGNIKYWDVEEKIDGTNIRIFFKNGTVSFGGRTKDAKLQPHLLEYLQNHFTPELLSQTFPQKEGDSLANIILFGEGYGPKIQHGHFYSKTPGFCLFDVKIGPWWLEKNVVRHEISEKLGISSPPCLLTKATEEQIIDFVKEKHFSRFALNDPKREYIMEGVMCRPQPLILFRNGDPIMFKLKCKEF